MLFFKEYATRGPLIAKLVVDLEKKLNPEKKGSVFEMQFQKTWLESCDEAQKQQHHIAFAEGITDLADIATHCVTSFSKLSTL